MYGSKLDNFETKISIHADVVQSNKPTEFLTVINSKLNVVAENIEAEKEQKLIQAKALNIIVFNIPESHWNSSVEYCKVDFNIIQESLLEN